MSKAAAKCISSNLRQLLKSAGNHTDSQAMQKYMRNQYSFFGVKAQARRSALRSAISSHPFKKNLKYEGGWDASVVVFDLCEELYSFSERECHQSATDFLHANAEIMARKFESTSPEGRQLACDYANKVMDAFVRKNGWWDTVDMVATQWMGTFLANATKASDRRKLARKWIRDDNKWVRRIALIFQLHYKAATDLKLLFELILGTTHEKEFFIQKAHGWALRQHSRTDAKAVHRFVSTNEELLSRVAKKEALRLIKTEKFVVASKIKGAATGKRHLKEIDDSDSGQHQKKLKGGTTTRRLKRQEDVGTLFGH
jgi:3-methyladenine DNA glycosylase AlkD